MSTKAYTIEEFINSKNLNQISYDKLSLYEQMESGDLFLVYNVLNDYYDEVIEHSAYLQLTDEEYMKYRFRPKLLAWRIYGDPELFFILLFLNNICSVKDFDFKRLRILKPNDLNQVISAITNSNYDLLKSKNRK